VPPRVGRTRLAGPADRLEAEPDEFHATVRLAYVDLADAAPDRYILVDGTLSEEQVDATILDRVKELGLS
jgi:dTMP kinase